MRLVPTLSIELATGGLRYRLDVPERDLGEPLQEEFRHPLDAGTLRTLLESAEAVLRGVERPSFAREAAGRGAMLYRTLVPQRLRTQLRAVTGPLLISTSLVGMPWELLHDDGEFWGLRYALGKRLVMDRPLLAAASTPLRTRPRALVIGSDPRADLPFVGPEVEAIAEALERVADLVCVSGRLATFDTVTARLSEGFDLIHYCGHVLTAPGQGPALLLADGQLLPGTVIEANLAGRPLVFLNGCASARGEDGRAAGPWEETFASVAYGFLFGGAIAVVGTLCDVSDRHAAALAEEFYRRVLTPAPVGEALREARAACRAHPDSAGSPTWLSFVLYGNPAQVLLRREERVPTSAPPPPIASVPAVTPLPQATRWHRWLAALLFLALVVTGGLVYFRQPDSPTPLIVGVMEVRTHGADVPAWMREMTRDGLNTILSKFDAIHVYSRQKIDFLRDKRQLGELEAAEALGMSKMLSATVTADARRVALELELVDIASGLLEATERVEGPKDEFMALQTELALRAVRLLGVKPTPEQLSAIVASRGNETVDVYRMLSETLGEPPTGRQKPAPAPPPAKHPDTSWLAWPASAQADEPREDEDAIRAVLDQYGAALEAKSVERLATLQVEMSEPQREALRRYFDNAGELRVRISDVDLLIEGDEALATFTREDAFLDRGSGRRMRLEVRISGVLTKEQGTWRIRGLRNPS